MKFNRKPRTIGQILIDLTPLLDVIFILLIIVLTVYKTNQDSIDKVYSDTEAAVMAVNAEKAEIEARDTVLVNQLQTYSELNSYINVISVYSEYSRTDRTTRTIYVVTNSEEKTFTLIGQNRKGWDDCMSYLESILKQNDSHNRSVPVLLSIADTDTMLYRDEQSLMNIFLDLSSRYDNIYLQNLTETDNE